MAAATIRGRHIEPRRRRPQGHVEPHDPDQPVLRVDPDAGMAEVLVAARHEQFTAWRGYSTRPA
jgi:hypothetical protein